VIEHTDGCCVVSVATSTAAAMPSTIVREPYDGIVREHMTAVAGNGDDALGDLAIAPARRLATHRSGDLAVDRERR